MAEVPPPYLKPAEEASPGVTPAAPCSSLNLAPNQNSSGTGLGPDAAAAFTTEITPEETASLTAVAAAAAADAAASAAATVDDLGSMDYVEVLLELPPNPSLLTSALPDVKPSPSHLRMALENY